MLSVEQGGIKYHFLSLWYDVTWDWTPVCWAIDEHSTTKLMQTRAKGVWDKTRVGCVADLLGIVQEIDFWLYYKWYTCKAESNLENERLKILLDFEIKQLP